MTGLIKKLHIYIGLLNFSNLMVFGVAGLAATFHTGPERTPAWEAAPRYESFTPESGLSDKQIADQVFSRLHFPLTEPIPSWALHRDAEGNLPLDFYTVNGIYKVKYLPDANRLRIRAERTNLWFFLDDMHTVTSLQQPDWRLTVWAYYNHFAIWSLLAMALSGTYLWLASQSRYRAAQYSFAGGAGVFILLYALTR